MKPVVWQGVRWTSTEFFTLESKGLYQLAQGNIAGVVRDMPFCIHYEIELTNDWKTDSFYIRSFGPDARELRVTSNLLGQWYDKEGNQIAAFDDCLDIDISLTPFTNSLPVNRLQMLPGQSVEINVIYILLPEFELQKVRQRYTMLRENYWLYENVDSDFSAKLSFDENGIMTDYPGLFQKRY
ncbi:putative glycolipid-binding domain-containing protein [Chitinophaga sp. CB10]|uniref:putative glycolipid-binding domain-containing protein n=1 Tax=Chitinophaga sp. CB10 TaxID=1891659 RepID=UPI000A48B6B1|nr:putative glycolipid-binding domain-containing protein [Chitinophaga sp. CB10]